MGESLAELYNRSQTAPTLTANLPEEIGTGRVARLSLPHDVSLSAWDMTYHRDTPVEGYVGNQLRILFCLGSGVEWRTDSGGTMRIDPGEACICAGDGATERMCYDAGRAFVFDSVSIASSRMHALLRQYFSDDAADRLPRALDGRRFPITSEMRGLLDAFRGLEVVQDGFGLMRLEGRIHELTALCMQWALERDDTHGLYPEDRAIIQAIRARIDENPSDAPDAAALAREYGVSVSKLARDFKRLFGTSLHAYVIEARLQEASRLLAHGEMSVGEVAIRVGYAKHGQFSAAFQRRFGVLPKDY